MEEVRYNTEVKADAINNAIRLFCLRACEYVNTSLCKRSARFRIRRAACATMRGAGMEHRNLERLKVILENSKRRQPLPRWKVMLRDIWYLSLSLVAITAAAWYLIHAIFGPAGN